MADLPLRHDAAQERAPRLVPGFGIWPEHSRDAGEPGAGSKSATTLKEWNDAFNGLDFSAGDARRHLPDLTLEGADREERQGEEPLAPFRLKTDRAGRIESITYPGGEKWRRFSYDAAGDLSAVYEEDAEGRRTFEKDENSGRWTLNVSGMRLALPGEIRLGADGEYSYQTSSDGRWRTELPDGRQISERLNDNGCRLAYDDGGQVSRITRADGSRIEIGRSDGTITSVVERDSSGNRLTWTRQPDGSFLSDSTPPDSLKDVKVSESGVYTREGSDGTRQIITADGTELREGPGNSRFTLNDRGQIESISYPDGKKVRQFQYDEAGKLAALTISDGRGGLRTFQRQPGSDAWEVKDQDGRSHGVWRGEVKLSASGDYSYRESSPRGDGMWQTYKPDGTVVKERSDDSGARLTYDTDGRLLRVDRPNGTALTCRYENGALSAVSECGRDGGRLTWSLAGDLWQCEGSPRRRRHALEARGDGSLRFKDGGGAQHTLRADGTGLIEKSDGSTVEVNAAGLVEKSTNRVGDTRTFSWDRGQLSAVTDRTGAGERTWSRRDGTDEWLSGAASESRKGLRIYQDGDMSYAGGDGTLVIDRSDLTRIELHEDYRLKRVTLASGARRDFGYDERSGELTSVTSRRSTASGDFVEKMSRDMDGFGNWTDRWTLEATLAGERKTGSIEGVSVYRDGDLAYTTSDGKEHIARTRDLDHEAGRFFQSLTVQEARLRLERAAEGSIANMGRFRGLLDQLEKRCAEAPESGLKAPDASQIAKTYDNLAAMLSPENGAAVMDQSTRARLAEQTAHNLAFPRSIDQGGNPTCNITTGEIYAATRHPDRYSDLVKQVSLSGQYVTFDGSTVRPGLPALAPGYEEANFDLDTAHQNQYRNHASKLFQVTAINSVTPGYVSGNPHFGIPRIVEGTKKVVGEAMPYFNYGEKVTQEALMKLKEAGQLPVGLLTIGTRHVQTIHDVRMVDGRIQVLFDDQHGEYNDRGWCDLSVVHARQGGHGGGGGSVARRRRGGGLFGRRR